MSSSINLLLFMVYRSLIAIFEVGMSGYHNSIWSLTVEIQLFTIQGKEEGVYAGRF